MKSRNLREQAEKAGGEYVFGAEDTGSHACYLIYGILRPGESGREVKPGKGHEEMLLNVSGAIRVSGAYDGMLGEGAAIHLRGEESCRLENTGTTEAIYVLAGGHSGHGHDH